MMGPGAGVPERLRMESSVVSSGSDMLILLCVRLRICVVEEALHTAVRGIHQIMDVTGGEQVVGVGDGDLQSVGPANPCDVYIAFLGESRRGNSREGGSSPCGCEISVRGGVIEAYSENP